MSSRDSFESLLQIWLILIRYICQNKDLIFIFGKNMHKNNILMTDEKEIKEIIRISEFECNYNDISEKGPEEINKIIEELIENSVENSLINKNKYYN